MEDHGEDHQVLLLGDMVEGALQGEEVPLGGRLGDHRGGHQGGHLEGLQGEADHHTEELVQNHEVQGEEDILDQVQVILEHYIVFDFYFMKLG